MPRKVFVAGEILTAADVNTNLMDQAVMVFDDATDRATAIPTPVEGMVTYLKDDDEVTVFDGSVFKAVGPGKILQIVTETATTQVSSASATFAATGLTASITPTATTSKVLVITSQVFRTAVEGSHKIASRLLRNSTVLVTSSEAAFSNTNAVMQYSHNHVFNFLDSPSSVSSVTYSTEFARTFGNNPSIVQFDGTNPAFITLMEVAG